MHGLGNDFVILDQRDSRKELPRAQITQICDRHFGVGCDQLIVMEPSDKAGLFMRIYNPDGSEAESCGNATRCVAHLFMSEQRSKECTVETLGGVLACRMAGDMVEVDMGPPREVRDIELSAGGLSGPVAVNMGNPHCVFFVDNAEAVAVDKIGPGVENHALFPQRTNVEFIHKMPDGGLRLRVWERGAGITLACGSGACAAMAASVHRGLTGRKADIRMDGGTLHMEQRESDGHILMTGPVAYVFKGVLKA